VAVAFILEEEAGHRVTKNIFREVGIAVLPATPPGACVATTELERGNPERIEKQGRGGWVSLPF
jgi:hypothetical protein